MPEIHFVDTTLRDGHLSLWATRMTTGMMLPVAEAFEQAGFQAIEIAGLAQYTKCVRELREDPWERVRLMAQRIRRTPLRSIRTRYMAAFKITPWSISDLWMERLAANGVREMRTSDPTNTPAYWARMAQAARRAGMETIINVTFSISPKHTDEYYREKVRAAARLDALRICLKDPGGLLTPDRTRTLARIFVENCGGKPLELHSHCNAGLGPLNAVEAMNAGFTTINVAVPPLANGTSLPSVYNVVENARTLGFTPVIDADCLRPVTAHFQRIAEQEGLPVGVPAEYNAFHFHHQVPGGMVSNLRFQLSGIGLENRLREVLEETVRVRQDLGYPIMVTPYAQFVGSQAAVNVMLGERYKEVTDQIIEYALGFWGEEESAGIDPEVKDRLLARPRARELAGHPPAEPSLQDLRCQIGGPGVDDDELLLRYFAGTAEVETMKAQIRRGGRTQTWTPASGPAPGDASQPLARLLAELPKRSSLAHVFIQKGNFCLQLAKPAPPVTAS